MDTAEKDNLIWYPSTSGKCTIRSTYIWKSTISSNTSILRHTWKCLQNSNLHGRQKQLLWKVVLDILPTKRDLADFWT